MKLRILKPFEYGIFMFDVGEAPVYGPESFLRGNVVMPVLERLVWGCGTMPIYHLTHFIDPDTGSPWPHLEGVVEVIHE